MRDKFSDMSDDELKEYIRANSKTSLGKKIKRTALTAANEASFGALKKIPYVKKQVEKHEVKNPTLSKVGKVAGFLGSLPVGGGLLKGAGAAAKLLPKGAKILKSMKGASAMKKAVGTGAAFGGMSAAGEGIGEDNLNAPDVAKGMAGGAVAGAAGRGAEKVIGRMAPKLHKKNKVRNALSRIGKKETDRAGKLKLGETLIDEGSPKTLSTANALRHGDEEVQGMFDKRMRNMTARNKDESYKLLDKHFGQDNLENFTNKITEREKAKTAPLYKKALQENINSLPPEVEGNYHFKKHRDKAYAERNTETDPWDRDSYTYLDRAKRNMQAKAQSNLTDKYEQNSLNEAAGSLRDSMAAQSPTYKKALDTSQDYLRPMEFGRKGQKFADRTTRPSDTAKLLRHAGKNEIKAHKLGAKDTLSQGIKNYSSNEGNIAGRLIKPNVLESLDPILGKQGVGHLKRDVDKAVTRHSNFANITRGSQTSKNLADTERNSDMFKSGASALVRPKRYIASKLDKAADKVNSKGTPKQVASMMLHPHHIKKLKKVTKGKSAGEKALASIPSALGRLKIKKEE
jgi:hypothetical protein